MRGCKTEKKKKKQTEGKQEVKILSHFTHSVRRGRKGEAVSLSEGHEASGRRSPTPTRWLPGFQSPACNENKEGGERKGRTERVKEQGWKQVEREREGDRERGRETEREERLTRLQAGSYLGINLWKWKGSLLLKQQKSTGNIGHSVVTEGCYCGKKTKASIFCFGVPKLKARVSV